MNGFLGFKNWRFWVPGWRFLNNNRWLCLGFSFEWEILRPAAAGKERANPSHWKAVKGQWGKRRISCSWFPIFLPWTWSVGWLVFDIMCLSEQVNNNWVSVHLPGNPLIVGNSHSTDISDRWTGSTAVSPGLHQQWQIVTRVSFSSFRIIVKDIKVLRVSFHVGHLSTRF